MTAGSSCRQACPISPACWRAGWERLPYPALCAEFLKLFATDVPPAVIDWIAREAYAGFAHPDIAPLRRLPPRLQVLELFHGLMLAF